MSLVNVARLLVPSIFLISSVAVFLIYYGGVNDLCKTEGNLKILCTSGLVDIKSYLFLIVVLLTPYFLTLFLITKIFVNWAKFALLSILIILTFYYYISQLHFGGGIGGAVEAGVWSLAFIILLIVHFLISFTIIGVSWWKNRKSN